MENVWMLVVKRLFGLFIYVHFAVCGAFIISSNFSKQYENDFMKKFHRQFAEFLFTAESQRMRVLKWVWYAI